jgi:hypothetical protein
VRSGAILFRQRCFWHSKLGPNTMPNHARLNELAISAAIALLHVMPISGSLCHIGRALPYITKRHVSLRGPRKHISRPGHSETHLHLMRSQLETHSLLSVLYAASYAIRPLSEDLQVLYQSHPLSHLFKTLDGATSYLLSKQLFVLQLV